MKRRTFIAGVGGSGIGASMLIGSGAFSRIESQRRVKIEVAKDPHAYLGLDGCPDSPNASYTNIDESGHLEVDMSSENPTDAGGEGINSDSRTWFDNVFQICNQGKQDICVWIDDENWPKVDDGELEGDYSEYDGDLRVDFYVGDNREQSILGSENAFFLGVGECICIGIHTNTKGLSDSEQLLSDLGDEIVIHADEDCPVDEPPVSGQTAWAILNDEPDPDENRLNSLTNISKWGWFMPYDISSGSDTDPVLAEFYAGAGRNNLNAGTDVGDVEISDDGDDLVVDIEMDPEFTLTESQLYVDTDTDRLRQIKAAPGAFDYKNTSDEYDPGAMQYTIPLDDVRENLSEGDELIIALHGVVE
ncbi:DUF1102 domain-containing protein [Natrialba swarupiae]|nr:DUF1102 domain-containing protein [Natrialba swarupiae]